MSEIAKLYDEIMSGEEIEKVASDTTADSGPEFDRTFFEKVAAGDEESVGAVNAFIDEARAEGHSDEEIEEAIGEAMQAAGYDEDYGDLEDDEFEVAKVSAYLEGSEQAVVDVLESDMAKEAGVTAEDLIEFELGGHFGAGYAETRAEAEEALAKIAAAKGKVGKKVRALGKNLMEKLRAGPVAAHEGLTRKFLPKNVMKLSPQKQQLAMQRARRMATGVMGAGVGAAGAGLGYGAYRMARGRNKNK